MLTGWIRPVSGLAASQVVVYQVVFISQCPLMASLGNRTGVLRKDSKTPGVVKAGSYIVEFNTPAYPGLYLSFPVILSHLWTFTLFMVKADQNISRLSNSCLLHKHISPACCPEQMVPFVDVLTCASVLLSHIIVFFS